MKVVVTMHLNEEQKAVLHDAAPDAVFTYVDSAAITEADVRDAAVILGNCNPELLSAASSLRWIQLNNAGAEGFWKSGHLHDGVLLTNASGAYGEVMAEHILAVLLALFKRLPLYYARQTQQLWQPAPLPVVLRGSRVLIVGFGDIGRSTARLLRGFGCHITGCKRSAGGHDPDADELCTLADIDTHIPQAAAVIMCLPAHAETYHAFNEQRIAAMNKHAVLINVGRGSTVDTGALVAALDNHTIAGAALDVTDPEPLPPDHPLWKCENVIITPHISGKHDVPAALDKIVAICAQNLRRYRAGEPLLNMVDRTTGYRRAEGRAGDPGVS
jgi:phosphoglycerate dehydrogenase-like enzyme